MSWQFAVGGWDTPWSGCSTRYQPLQLWCVSLCMLLFQDYALLGCPLVMVAQWRAVESNPFDRHFTILYTNLLFSCILAKLYHLEFQYPKKRHHLKVFRTWNLGDIMCMSNIVKPSPGLHRKGLRVVADVVFNHVAWRGWVCLWPIGFWCTSFSHKPTYDQRLHSWEKKILYL